MAEKFIADSRVIEVLTAALEACEKLKEKNKGNPTIKVLAGKPLRTCRYCFDGYHNPDNNDCPLALSERALDMAHVKGVL